MDRVHANPPSGRIIHLVNCTYCKHRLSITKGLDGKYELELCSLTRNRIPAPSQPNRFCDHFQKKDCPCPNCNEIKTDGTNH